jgi:FAD/FMN-containing dehydrogenase
MGDDTKAKILATRLKEALGDDAVLTSDEALAPHLVEWRKLYRGHADVLVKPRDAIAVSAVMRIAHDLSVPVTPQGGRTGLVGGGVPDGGLILSLERLTAIRSINPANAAIIAEAGVPLATVQHRAEEAGMLFPLSLASEGTCTIGGNLSTNAGGTAVLRYGNMRDLCLGLEVVLADGTLLDGLRMLRKDNAGYDLKQLFIGSEGTLGIITAAVLKLFPAPRSSATAFAGIESPRAAFTVFTLLRARFGEALTTFELLPRFGLDMVLRYAPALRDPLGTPAPWYLLIELSQSFAGGHLAEALEEALGDCVEQGAMLDATIAASETQANMLWRLREDLSDAQTLEGASIKHDVSVPLDCVPDLIERGSAAAIAAMPGLRPCPFGHMGDGNLHFNLTQPAGMEKQAFLAEWPKFNAIIHDLVLSMGGSIAAEHGVGIQKCEELARVKPPADMEAMRRMKLAFDPKGILNPGKILARGRSQL